MSNQNKNLNYYYCQVKIRLEGWKVGRVEEGKSGRGKGWKSGRLEEWKIGRVEDWKDGRKKHNQDGWGTDNGNDECKGWYKEAQSRMNVVQRCTI